MFKKMFPLLLILLTVAYLSKDAWLPGAKKDKQTMVATQFPVRVTAVSTGTLQEELKFPMELKAVTEAKVIPSYLGRIEALYVQEGSVVKAGEPLYKYVGPQVGEEGFFDDLIVKSPITGVVLSVVKDVGGAVEKYK
jgi:multidrug efflux pump subunit AcrA (membrane-fusion protein)